jgi:hypothetical protein
MNPDKIRTFCNEFASRNRQNWPPDEEMLANAFISYFELPPFVPGVSLEKMCARLEIQFVKEKLPDDLFGSNFHFAGKRRIAVNNRPEGVGMKEHTAFHEIRELLEYEFHEIGLPTAKKNSEELEYRADEFALCAMCGSDETWQKLTESASQIRPTLLMFGLIFLIFAARFIFLLNAQSCAQYTGRTDLRGSTPSS